jgi:exopolyphosphatase/guanosine-5'-triphosphate,3'-diphosphate pyrophosphatase
MPCFAAIDVGSNASRLLVAEAEEPSTIRYVESMRAPVRLGHAVFLTGRLDPHSIEQCVEALTQFRAHLATRQVASLRAVVTASARDAVNADELLERAREEAGVELEAISGTEEARLVKLAVDSKLALEGARALLVDLGGGSLELT